METESKLRSIALHDTVCIDRKSGDYPIKVFTVEVGTRRPLGVGAGSIAVLAAMPEGEALAVLDSLKEPLQAHPEQLRRGVVPAVRAARKAGYAVSDGLVLQTVIGVGVAIRDPYGKVIGSLGIASFKDNATGKRVAEYVTKLARERTKIERMLRETMTAKRTNAVAA